MFENLILLADPLTRHIFEFIAKRRMAVYKDIRYAVEGGGDEHRRRPDEILNRLQKLRHAGLIEEQDSPITNDFNTYYLTAEGLSVERKLRQRAAAA